ncbi:Glutamate receptor 2.1 [Morella rubra]|uniref:Glutamate receptor 2.1 n=1 Tax=Morella rubra TaxID=262757 RepID=A0A6A1W6U0_9ROSI|nr:Glutamate receptor 2.1 [Morella rubra]
MGKKGCGQSFYEEEPHGAAVLSSRGREWIRGKTLFIENDEQNNGSGNIFYNRSTLAGLVIWQGNLNRTPKGWEMPTDAKPLRIGVPSRTTFDKFVKVEYREKPNENRYDGFCIQIFYKVLELLDYDLPYEFNPYNGTGESLQQSHTLGDCSVALCRVDPNLKLHG